MVKEEGARLSTEGTDEVLQIESEAKLKGCCLDRACTLHMYCHENIFTTSGRNWLNMHRS